MQNDYRQCKWCGQIYRYIGNQFCTKCVNQLDQDFRKIKDFLYKNPDAVIPEVVDATGVDERVVFLLLKEGRLEMKASNGFLICENCGAPIGSGKLCMKCSTSLSSTLSSAVENQRASIQKEQKKDIDKDKDSLSRSRMHTYTGRK